MGLKAIYCNEDVLAPTMAKSGERASASSDFSGKDLLTYAGIMTALAALSGCVSNDNAVTEANKTEVQHSASGEGGKPSPDVTTTTPVTKHDTTTTTPVAAYDPATFEVPKEHGPLPHNQVDHLFATPGDMIGVSATRRDGAGRSDFWVVYEGISKVDGETVKITVGDNGKSKEIDAPRYVANFDMWEYSTASNKVVGQIHRTLEAGEYYKYHTSWDGFEGKTNIYLTLKAIDSGNNKDVAANCGFIKDLINDNPNDDKGPECFVTDGKSMEDVLSYYSSKGDAIKEKDLSADEKLFLNNVRTMLKYDSENPQGYAIFSIVAHP